MVKTKTAAPCCSNSYSNWNPAQKHTNIHCQTCSRTVLVILKPQRPFHGVLVCSLPYPSCSLFIASTLHHHLVSRVQLKISSLTVKQHQDNTHHFAQRNSSDQETVKKQPWTNRSKDPKEDVRIWAWFWFWNRNSTNLRQVFNLGPYFLMGEKKRRGGGGEVLEIPGFASQP